MSAPDQATFLPGFGPAPDQPAHFAVLGVLRDPARVLVDHTSGAVLLQVVITQLVRAHPTARHVVATWHYPDLGDLRSTEAAVRALAAQMQRGEEVVARGSAMYGSQLDASGEPVLLLADVRGIALAERTRQLIQRQGAAHVSTLSTTTPTPAYGGTPA